MTIGTDALLARFHQTLKRSPPERNLTVDESRSTKTTHSSQRQYRTHARRTCYQCRQEGHYARDCPRSTTPKTTETRMEKMRLLLKTMTLTERAQFKREISPRMRTMQTHLRTMTTFELKEFKRQITPNTTRTPMTISNNEKTLANPLSRETSPRTDRMIAELPPSRETGPHPNKSIKKLAQALKKRIRHETKPRTHTPKLDYPFEVFAKTLKSPIQISRPNSPMKRLANALKRRIRRRERCAECGEGHPTPLCTKHLERLREPRVTSPFMFDDSPTNGDTLRSPERPINNESDLLTNLEKAMAKLSMRPPKTVTFDLPESTPDTPSDDVDEPAD